MDAYKDVYRRMMEVIPKFNIECARKSLQFLLFLVNVLFGILGTLFIVVGIWFFWFVDPYTFFVGRDVMIIPIVFVVIGLILFFISFLGSIATVKESTLIANLYAAILIVAVIVETNAVITLSIMYGNTDSKIVMNMQNSLNNNTINDHMEVWDTMQLNLCCCGVRDSEEWASLGVYGVKWNNYNQDFYTVPYSCCEVISFSNERSQLECTSLRSNGCYYAMMGYMYDTIGVLGTIAGVALIAQVVGSLLAFILAKVIRRSKTSKELENQELQHLICNNSNQSEEDKDALIQAQTNI